MREIKFRVWDKQLGWMLSVIDIAWDNEGNITDIVALDDVNSNDVAYYGADIKDRLVLMQYTGFKGCEDIEIYEGDIVSFSVFDRQGSDTQFSGVIKFGEGAWKIWHDNENEYYGCDGAFSLDWVIYEDDTIEVIGSIYENPELIGGVADDKD